MYVPVVHYFHTTLLQRNELNDIVKSKYQITLALNNNKGLLSRVLCNFPDEKNREAYT